jgi:hypothetical protein
MSERLQITTAQRAAIIKGILLCYPLSRPRIGLQRIRQGGRDPWYDSLAHCLEWCEDIDIRLLKEIHLQFQEVPKAWNKRRKDCPPSYLQEDWDAMIDRVLLKLGIIQNEVRDLLHGPQIPEETPPLEELVKSVSSEDEPHETTPEP